MIYIDLVGLDEAEASIRLRERIAGSLRGRSKPSLAPPSPIRKTAAGRGRVRFATGLPPVWNVPYRRNPTFTGRDEALATLARQLDTGMAAAVIQAIQGTGGVGKTAVAVEYAYRHRAEFDTVWWVRAEQPATLIGDYAELATTIGLPDAAAAEQQMVVAAVRRWLATNDRWLLVLDNAEGPQAETGMQSPLAHLADLVPQVAHGQVLVTSRDITWDDAADLVELDLLIPQDAVRFLLARTGSQDRQAAAELADALGYLPLALEQVGAYVRETRISLAVYLDRLRQFPMVAMSKGRPRDRDPTETVATIWQVSLERVRPVPGAVALLEACAFLAPEDVPRDLFAQRLDATAAPEDQELAALAADPFALDDAVAALRRYGLVKATEDALTMHRLLQQVVRDRLDPSTASRRVGLVVRLLAAVFPREGYRDPRTWPTSGRLLAHVLAVADQAQQRAAELGDTAMLLDRAGGYLLGRARYREARALYERALALTEATFGPDHIRTGFRLHNLGFCLMRQHEVPALARQYLERSLDIEQATLGPEHPSVAIALAHLGQVMRQLGELGGARQQLERALAIAEAGQGPDHLNVSIILDHLGEVLCDLGEVAAARHNLERAVAIAEATLGPDHLNVAAALAHLGHVLRESGDLDGARSHLERALAIDEAAAGPNHPGVAITLAHLGRVLGELGDLDGARQYLERALAISEAALGPEDPRTRRLGTLLVNLAPGSATTK